MYSRVCYRFIFPAKRDKQGGYEAITWIYFLNIIE